jgi:hypothetical protein
MSVMLPLLIVSPSLALICQALSPSSNVAGDTGDISATYEMAFALFCEGVNYAAVTTHRGGEEVLSSSTPAVTCRACCFSCKGTDVSLDVEPNVNVAHAKFPNASAVKCSSAFCSTIMHMSCLVRDDSVLVRCRCCPTAFCPDHIPDWKSVHIYGVQWIACPKCAVHLEPPSLSPKQLDDVLPVMEKQSGNEIARFFALERERRLRRISNMVKALPRAVADGNSKQQFSKLVRQKSNKRRSHRLPSSAGPGKT